MPLLPPIAEFLASLPPHEPGLLDPAALRASEEALVPPLAERRPGCAVRDLDADGVPVRVYLGEGAPAVAGTSNQRPAGVIVYLHGGAFFLGSLNTHDHVARELAVATGFAVVSVGYRLAPEHAFPAGLEDCAKVVRWLASPAGEQAVPRGGEVFALAGDSSGGTFVAALTGMLHDAGASPVTHQILFYPSLDLDFDEESYPSLSENAVGYGLETAGLGPFNAFYIGSGADPADQLVSPIKRAELAGLPQALIVTAEFDPLRDEGEAYAAKLSEAGVPVLHRRWPGVGHGFVQHFGTLPETHGVYELAAEFLRGSA